jgi:hypothetical protein
MMSPERKLVPLAQCATASEAEMVVELLEREAVQAMISGSYDPFIVTGAYPAIVYVNETDLAEAHRLYAAFFHRSPRDAESSPQEDTHEKSTG